MDKDQLEYFDSNDNRSIAKYISAQSFTQSTTSIKENKREMHSKVYYSFSLIFAVFLAIFSNFLGWAAFLIILDLSLIVLIYYARKFYIRRRELARDHEKIRKNLNEWGIDIKPI